MKKTLPAMAVLAALTMLALPLWAQDKSVEKKAEKAAEKAAGAGNAEMKVVEMEPFSYIAVEMTGSYEQHPNAFMQLYSAAAQQGLPMSDAPFGIYWNSPNDTAEEELKWEIGMQVPGDKEVLAPLVLKKWEHTKALQKEWEGAIDSEEMQAVYFSMFQWMEANGFELAGPMLEKFLTSPAPNDKGEFVGKVQIIFPVQKKK